MTNNIKLGYLKKHVGMVHCAASLSTIQRKVANVLLYNARLSNIQENCFSISIGSLAKLINYNSNDYKSLKISLIKLIRTTVEWNILSNNGVEEEWTVSSILASAKAKKNGMLEYSYSKHLLDFICYPSQYAIINMNEFVKLKSQYSLSLYEQCSRYIRIGQTCWMNVNLFKKIMGVPENNYKLFKDFRKRVINQAANEINVKTTLKISLETKRNGRNIEHIKFKIKDTGEDKISQATNKQDLSNNLKESCSFTNKEIEKLTNNHDPKVIKEKLEYMKNTSSYKDGKIKNLKGYLIQAINKNYELSSNINLTNLDYDNLEQKYLAYKYSTVKKWMLIIDSSDWFSLRKEFLNYIKNKDNNDIYLNYLQDNFHQNNFKNNKHFGKETIEEISRFIQYCGCSISGTPKLLMWKEFIEQDKKNNIYAGENEKISS